MEATAGNVTDEIGGPESRPAKRFNLFLSPEAYDDVQKLSEMGGGRSMSDVLRLALSLLKTIYPAILRGEDLYLVDARDNTERQIILPK